MPWMPGWVWLTIFVPVLFVGLSLLRSWWRDHFG